MSERKKHDQVGFGPTGWGDALGEATAEKSKSAYGGALMIAALFTAIAFAVDAKLKRRR